MPPVGLITIEGRDAKMVMTAAGKSNSDGWTVIEAVVVDYSMKTSEDFPEVLRKAMVQSSLLLIGAEIQLKHKPSGANGLVVTYQNPDGLQWSAEEVFELSSCKGGGS